MAVAVRITPLLLGGGLGFIGRYDDGVYYSAADALSFGRVPYKQFLLLHPPGILIVLLPFAALGRVTSDMTGMETARVAFMALGAVNTVLVASIAQRWGRSALVVAGLMYACWLPAVYAEQSTFLEPVGGFLVLVALHRLLNRAQPPSVRAELVAGMCLGLATTVKIWYVAPWAAIVAWQLLARHPKGAGRLMMSGVAAVAVVVTPFAILAGNRMEQMVIRDQIFRPAEVVPRLDRVTGLLGIRTFTTYNLELRHVLTGVLVAAFAMVIAGALLDRAARPLAALLLVNIVVLLASPVFLRHYSSFIAGPAAVLVGVGVARLYGSRRWRRIAPIALVGVLAACLVSGAVIGLTKEEHAFPDRRGFEAAAPAGCIAADDPLALAEIDRLSSDFRDHCRVDIDVSGALLDRYSVRAPDGWLVPRRDNLEWQTYLYQYLTTARAFVLCRQPSDGIFGSVAQSYRRFPLLMDVDDNRDELRLGNAAQGVQTSP